MVRGVIQCERKKSRKYIILSTKNKIITLPIPKNALNELKIDWMKFKDRNQFKKSSIYLEMPYHLRHQQNNPSFNTTTQKSRETGNTYRTNRQNMLIIIST